MTLRCLSNYDFKATVLPNVWNCLPVAQTLDPLTLLFITAANGSMQKVMYPIVKSAAETTNTPVVLLSGVEFENQPLLNSIQATTPPQLYFLDSTGTVASMSKYIGLRRVDSLVDAINAYKVVQ